MSDFAQTALALIGDFGLSDVAGCAPNPLHAWLANSFGHFAFGIIAALWRFPRWALLLAWAALAAKETALDLPADGFAALTMLDSAVDLALPLMGFILARHRLERMA